MNLGSDEPVSSLYGGQDQKERTVEKRFPHGAGSTVTSAFNRQLTKAELIKQVSKAGVSVFRVKPGGGLHTRAAQRVLWQARR